MNPKTLQETTYVFKLMTEVKNQQMSSPIFCNMQEVMLLLNLLCYKDDCKFQLKVTRGNNRLTNLTRSVLRPDVFKYSEPMYHLVAIYDT